MLKVASGEWCAVGHVSTTATNSDWQLLTATEWLHLCLLIRATDWNNEMIKLNFYTCPHWSQTSPDVFLSVTHCHKDEELLVAHLDSALNNLLTMYDILRLAKNLKSPIANPAHLLSHIRRWVLAWKALYFFFLSTLSLQTNPVVSQLVRQQKWCQRKDAAIGSLISG